VKRERTLASKEGSQFGVDLGVKLRFGSGGALGVVKRRCNKRDGLCLFVGPVVVGIDDNRRESAA
jgi:hypothetical protein